LICWARPDSCSKEKPRSELPVLHSSRWTPVCVLVLILSASLAGGCSRQAHVSAQRKVTIYFCRPGTDTLVPMHYSVNGDLAGPALEQYALNQLLAGPGTAQNAVVVFPAGTRASLTHVGNRAQVDLRGPIARAGHTGTSDEIALFKSLVYTLTELPGIAEVQVLVDGRKTAALPGGHFELDEPLNRDTFTQ
jgi:germination protein M